MSHGAPGGAGNPGAAEWAVLLYMGADKEVATEARADVEELDRAAHLRKANVYRLFDHPGGCERRVWVRGEERGAAESTEVNMGDPDSLARGLGEAARTFGAARRALVIWGHGTGWVGQSTPTRRDGEPPAAQAWYRGDIDTPNGLVVRDPQTGDYLDTRELDQALGAACADGPLGLLGLDACHMAGVETLARLARHADLIVASADRMVAGAWDYGELVRVLARRGADAVAAAVVLAEGYGRAVAADPRPRSLVALRAADARELVGRLDALGGALVAEGGWADGRLPRALAAAAVEPYGDRTFYGYDLVDLVQVLACAQVSAASLALARAMAEVAVKACAARWVSAERPDRVGLSVYLGDRSGVPTEYDAVLPREHGWQRFLRGAWPQREGAPPA